VRPLALPAIALLIGCLAAAPVARAERVHGSVGVGGWSDPVHAGFGGWAGGDLWPWKRWGVRLDARIDAEGEPVRVEAALARILGDSRPHLVVSFHAGGGWSFPDDALLLSGGIAGQLGIVKPIALGLDGTVQNAIGEDGYRLHWLTTLSVLVAW
jgi:hypothetical protein